MNQKSNKEYAEKLWKCEECGKQDTNSHLLWCTGYSELREGKDLSCDKQLCNYLQKIFLLRNEKLLNEADWSWAAQPVRVLAYQDLDRDDAELG